MTTRWRFFRMTGSGASLRGAIEVLEASLNLSPGHCDQAVLDAPWVKERDGLICGVVADDGVGVAADDLG